MQRREGTRRLGGWGVMMRWATRSSLGVIDCPAPWCRGACRGACVGIERGNTRGYHETRTQPVGWQQLADAGCRLALTTSLVRGPTEPNTFIFYCLP